MEKVSIKTKYLSAKRVATVSVTCAMALVMFVVENLFPPLFLPGAKMGLSNIFSLLTLVVFGPIDALLVVVVRTVLGSLICSNVSTLIYSLTAGVFSLTVSAILMQIVYPKVSLVCVSIVSAVVHNITQVVVFCVISKTVEMYTYAPWMALLGVIAGTIVGFSVWLAIKYLPLKTFLNASQN